MLLRLAIFVVSLLALPWLGAWLTGTQWDMPNGNEINLPATLLTTLALFFYVFSLNHWLKRTQSNAPLGSQPRYFWAMAFTSALTGWLLVYLNSFVATWGGQSGGWQVQALLFTPLFAFLMPAILLTRTGLSLMPNLLKRLASGIPLPAPRRETLVLLGVALSALGLLSGAAWSVSVVLFWLAPLLLLVTLQLLWHESTVFSALPNGDWGRVVVGALAGTLVGNLAVVSYQYNGGTLDFASPWLNQFGFILFGWLTLQLGDVVAEFWRGTARGNVFKTKKTFPIPVVVEKSNCRK